jgi:putative FmdB family regulatory protein
MPTFNFKCSNCSLIFDKIVRKSVEKTPCKSCGSESHKILSNFGSFSFQSGSHIGNSGVDSLDSSIDKRIGRDADDRWEHLKEIDKVKNDIRKNGSGRMLVRDFENDTYREATVEEDSKNKNLHKAIQKKLTEETSE